MVIACNNVVFIIVIIIQKYFRKNLKYVAEITKVVIFIGYQNIKILLKIIKILFINCISTFFNFMCIQSQPASG